MFTNNPDLKHFNKKEIEEEESEHGAWALYNSEFVVLVLLFFVMFFSVNSPKGEPKKAPSNLESLLQSLQSSSLLHAQRENKQVNKDSAWKGFAYPMDNHLLIEFPGVSFYDSGETEISKDGGKALNEFMKAYQAYSDKYQLSVRVISDNRPVRQEPGRRFKDNQELSILRSVAGIRYLQKLGVPLRQMKLGDEAETQLTAKELVKATKENRLPASEDKQVRKLVLVIEP